MSGRMSGRLASLLVALCACIAAEFLPIPRPLQWVALVALIGSALTLLPGSAEPRPLSRAELDHAARQLGDIERRLLWSPEAPR